MMHCDVQVHMDMEPIKKAGQPVPGQYHFLYKNIQINTP